MKRLAAYKKEYGVTAETTLKDLKRTYRNFMKEWHPDKFAGNEEKLEEAEIKSKSLIEAYHFLVSMSPETLEANKEKYTETITNGALNDFEWKKSIMKMSFADGSEYEYFGVQEKTYIKLCNANNQYRFAKRHIFPSHKYRQVTKLTDDQ